MKAAAPALLLAALAATGTALAQAPGPPGYPSPNGGFRIDDPRLLLPQYDPQAIPMNPQPRLDPPGAPGPQPQTFQRLPYPGALRPERSPAPSAGGFVMTYSLAAAAIGQPAALARPRDIPAALMRCWKRPQGEPDSHLEATLRVSFARSGALIGAPRVTYANAAGERRKAVADSFVAAVVACAPLDLEPSLGKAIAGRVFTIRFIAPRPRPKQDI